MKPAITRPAMTALSAMLAALGAVAVAVVTVVGMTAVARADANQSLEFSSDGERWSYHAPALFPGAAIVPNTHITSTVWVRHHGASSARIEVSVADDAADPGGAELREWLTVTINRDVTAPGETWRGPIAEPGDAVAISIRVAFDPEAPESTRRHAADVLTHLTFRGVPVAVAPTPAPPTAGPSPANAPPADSPIADLAGDVSQLATTGAAVVAGLFLAGGVVVLGTVLRRRRPARHGPGGAGGGGGGRGGGDARGRA